LVISNYNSFWLLFDKIASVYFIWKIYLYFSIGYGQPWEPALCQLHRHFHSLYSSQSTNGVPDYTVNVGSILEDGVSIIRIWQLYLPAHFTTSYAIIIITICATPSLDLSHCFLANLLAAVQCAATWYHRCLSPCQAEHQDRCSSPYHVDRLVLACTSKQPHIVILIGANFHRAMVATAPGEKTPHRAPPCEQSDPPYDINFVFV